jgi:AcrR family transcriptional regulator
MVATEVPSFTASVWRATLTMESVAARAKTGVAVLYRRWPRKDDLVLDAIQHYAATHPVEVPDTGSLRGDMIAMLSSFSSVRVSFAAVISAVFSGLLASSGLTPAQVRESSSPTARFGPGRSTAAQPSAARSTSTASPRSSCPCRST